MSGLTVARKRHTCVCCDQHIEPGERHQSGVELPSQNPDVETPWRWHAHPDCLAFHHEFIQDAYFDWDECKREYGWDDWLANRVAATDSGEAVRDAR